MACLSGNFLQAGEVSQKMAQEAAQTWMARNRRPLDVQFKSNATMAASTVKDAKGRTLFHVMSLADGGFVITSGDTQVSPVVAFSGDGKFDADAANPLYALLVGDISNQLDRVTGAAGAAKTVNSTRRTTEDKWADLIASSVRERSVVNAKGTQGPISDVRVAPLIQSKWDQSRWNGENTFNIYTPNNYVCGCVATAFSQIMRYWKMPVQAVEPGTYVCWVDGAQTSKTQMGGVYDWDNMPLTSAECQTAAQRQAIGHLAYDVGVASQMAWSAKGSGTWGPVTTKALAERFGYASASVYWSSMSRENIIGVENYRNAILASLDASMPVEMGISGDGGHSVVADGYGFNGSRDVWCHVNCGWSGSDDLWYNLIREEMTDYKFITLSEVSYNIHPTEIGEVISGRVISQNATALAGAVVRLNGNGVSKNTTANEQGIYAFRVTEPGTYRLQATKDGIMSEPLEIKISECHRDAKWVLDETQHSFYYYLDNTVANRWGNDLTVDVSSLCTVTFNGGGGEGTMAQQAFTANVAQPLAANRFVRTGYNFAGWATRDGGSVVYGDGEAVSLSADATLYAVWTLKTYSVVFNANGGAGTMAAQTFTHGEAQALAGNSFTRTGHVFAGWALTPDGDVAYADAQSLSVTGSLTLYAVWAGMQATVTFDFAGGTGKIAAVTAIYGRHLPGIDRPVRAGGFEFDGFYVGPDGTGEQYYLASADSARVWDRTADTTLYAKWRPLSATLWIEGDTLRSVAMNGYTEVVVPEGVKIIGFGALANCDTLETLRLPESLETIERYAFSGCSALKEVTVPANVKKIDESAFADCRGLTRISLPDGLTEIGDDAFARCTSLAAVTIPAGVTSLGRRAFEDCSALTDATVPGGVGEIGLATFSGCGSLTRLTLGEGITVIGMSAFSDCSNLRALTFPATLKEIGSYAFSRCDGLTDVTLPDGLAAIDTDAFSYCTGLAQMTIPGNVEEIGGGAFEYCTALRQVTIREGVKVIGYGAFEHCESLQTIGIPASVENIGSWAFYDCLALEEVVIPGGGNTVVGDNAFWYSGLKAVSLGGGVVSIGSFAFADCEDLSSVSLAEGLKAIGSQAFYKCGSLVDVTLPSSVTNLGRSAFANCTSLEDIAFPAGLKKIESGVVSRCSSLRHVVVPEGVQMIGTTAFSGCENLEEVFLPNGLTNIAGSAFSSCAKLRQLTIPPTVDNIGSYAFNGCQSLTALEIPASVSEIGSGAFGGCSSLSSLSVAAGNSRYAAADGFLYERDGGELIAVALAGKGTVEIPSDIRRIGDSVFEYNHELTSLVLPDNIREIGTDAFYGCSNLTAVVIPSGVTNIGSWAFAGCVSLTDVTLPDTLTSLPNGLFARCAALRSVAIPPSVVSIGPGAFRGCSGLESIDIPAGVASIGVSAFAACGSLQAIRVAEGNAVYKSMGGAVYSVDGQTLLFWPGGVRQADIPEGVTAVGEDAFADCESLVSVTLPTTLRELGDGAFSGCDALETVDLPAGLTRLGQAFSFCYGLTHLTIPASVTSLDDRAFSYCERLKIVVLPDTMECIGESAFDGCEALEDITLSDNLKDIADEAFAKCRSLLEIDIPGSVTNVGSGAFMYCSSLERVSVPAGVIGGYSFGYCSNLVTVALGEGVTTVDMGAFQDCVSLERIVIPDSVKWISQSAFENCIGLKYATIGAGVTWLGREAFKGDVSLEEVVFRGNAPDMVQVLAFQDVNPDCIVSVSPDSSGWGVAVPGYWQGLAIRAVAPEAATVTVRFDAAGGEGGGAQTVAEGGMVGLLPTASREGAVFTGWYTSPSGGVRVESDTLATSGATYYAHWAVVPVPSEPTNVVEETLYAGVLDMGFAKAQTVDGALCDRDGRVVGTMLVKAGKVNTRKETVKISAAATVLMAGKAKKITARAVSAKINLDGTLSGTLAFKAPIGDMAFEMASDGTFSLKNASYLMVEATVGGALKGGARGTFQLADFDLAVSGLQEDLLPYREEFSVSGSKWQFKKAATVKWAKNKATGEYGRVVDESNNKTNRSSLKLTYVAKKGVFKGSFKAYALENAVGGKKKLKKYTVNVIGLVVDGKGQGEASCKRPAGGPWPVTVE